MLDERIKRSAKTVRPIPGAAIAPLPAVAAGKESPEERPRQLTNKVQPSTGGGGGAMQKTFVFSHLLSSSTSQFFICTLNCLDLNVIDLTHLTHTVQLKHTFVIHQTSFSLSIHK